MNIRPTQTSTFNMVRSGMSFNFELMIRAQEQVASGKRILRPSDDAVGTALLLSLKRRVGEVDRYMGAVERAKPMVDSGAAALQEGVSLMSEARELLIQGMNGTLSAQDRNTLAGKIDLLRDRLLAVGNSRSGDRFIFAGNAGNEAAFREQTLGGISSVVYAGDAGNQSVMIGFSDEMEINLSGAQVFARDEPMGTLFSGLTGVSSGTTADDGRGYEYLHFVNTGTSGALGAGLAFAAGASDTILNDHTLTVDGVAGTVQLGGGVELSIPTATDPNLADFVVKDEFGAELHLDFTGYTGADFTGVVTGDGSVSVDGTTFVPLTFAETDLELIDPDTGAVIHLDTTAVHRSGVEMASFQGRVNAFDVLQGIADDLRNGHDLSAPEILERLEVRLGELDRNADHILSGLSELGGRSAQLIETRERLEGQKVHLQGLSSNVEDADISSVILDLTKAEQALQLAQMTGARLIQSSLMNFLR